MIITGLWVSITTECDVTVSGHVWRNDAEVRKMYLLAIRFLYFWGRVEFLLYSKEFFFVGSKQISQRVWIFTSNLPDTVAKEWITTWFPQVLAVMACKGIVPGLPMPKAGSQDSITDSSEKKTIKKIMTYVYFYCAKCHKVILINSVT